MCIFIIERILLNSAANSRNTCHGDSAQTVKGGKHAFGKKSTHVGRILVAACARVDRSSKD